MPRITNWKYVCPWCGSQSVRKMQGSENSEYDNPYRYCRRCETTGKYVYDQKKSHRIMVKNIDHTEISL